MGKQTFIDDVKTLRKFAREKMEQGAITSHYTADLSIVIELLNAALATELICVLRYKNHYYKAQDLGHKVVADEFLEHALQEQDHADKLANRIAQLGHTPKMSPHYISEKSHTEYIECETVEEMINENLIAERIAVDSYRQMIKYINNDDPTTRRVLEEILSVEEEHANDLLELKMGIRQ